MKNLLSLIIISVAMLTVNCSSPQEETHAVLADNQLSLKVDGMVCAVGCAKYIEKQVSKIEGVTACTVNFDEGTASIAYSSESISKDDIIETITGINDGQYQVEVLEEVKESKQAPASIRSEKAKEKNETEVSFRFPELVTYFMSRIIR
jgi:Cu+-exporting ATPase